MEMVELRVVLEGQHDQKRRLKSLILQRFYFRIRSEAMRLSELGERNIIKTILRVSSQNGADDCYAMDNGDEYILISSDIISRESHLPSMQHPDLIGRFLANINLSDIAAMAGIPTGMTVSYLMDGETSDSFLRSVNNAIREELRKHGAYILGGDTKEGNGFVISGTILGRQKKDLTRFRSQIAPRQIIGHTNSLGNAGSGFIFYKSGYSTERGINLLLGVKARVREAQVLSSAGARFMMDMSDGLFSTISQMKEDYGVGFKIIQDEIKTGKDVEKASLISGFTPLEISANFGGDYELLFTVNQSEYEKLKDAAVSNGIDVSFIGETWEGDNLIYDGEQWTKITRRGWEHFSGNVFIDEKRINP